MFLNALFWNIGKLTDYSLLSNLCQKESIDILLTAEDKTDDTLNEINKPNSNFKKIMSTNSRGLRFYSRNLSKIESLEDELYYSAKCLDHPRIGKILIILVHFPSKMHATESDQKSFISRKIAVFERIERRIDTKNTIIIGDFNCNPHEEPMLSADCFNAVSCSRIASKESRKVKGENYHFFYNPMWKFYTKTSGVGHGTFYWQPKGFKSLYWNIFDQAFYRPGLINEIEVNILENTLLNDNTEISLIKYADHLPIKISIKL